VSSGVIVGAAGDGQVAWLVRLVNAAYAAGEAGLLLEGTARTDEVEIAAAEGAGEMLVATADGLGRQDVGRDSPPVGRQDVGRDSPPLGRQDVGRDSPPLAYTEPDG
jgi:hypothetical protein